ncbi:MAG TPA: SAM-dependent methyltransferase, partial [Devosia sp.]|nr:SAM-dependent methyltransferase [Devosia sp.]
MSGTLHLIGVGPGDPDLLTIRAVRVLRTVHVVAYPATGEDSAFAREIAADYIEPDAILMPVTIPMAIDRGPAQVAYDGAATQIL